MLGPKAAPHTLSDTMTNTYTDKHHLWQTW